MNIYLIHCYFFDIFCIQKVLPDTLYTHKVKLKVPNTFLHMGETLHKVFNLGSSVTVYFCTVRSEKEENQRGFIYTEHKPSVILA
jgi:hypothetical protein